MTKTFGEKIPRRTFETYFGPGYSAVLRPVPTPVADNVTPIRPVRSTEEGFKLLASYTPTSAEMELLTWGQLNLEQHIAAELEGVLYRSFKTFHLAEGKVLQQIRAKARDLKIGLPD